MRLKYLLITLLGALGCTYEEDPLSIITPDEFFLEARDAQSSVDAIYHYLHGGSGIYGKYYGVINGLSSDLGWYQGSDLELSEFSSLSVSPTNAILQEMWEEWYRGIAAANYAIANLPNTPVSADEKNALTAEARFLRAVFYFDLVRCFGGVPIVTDAFELYGDNYFISRSDLTTTQQFIQDELMFCLDNLPAQNDAGRPVALSAAAYLAKFYLTVGEYNRAFQATRLIIRSEQFSLVSDYASLFRNSVQNSPEDILSIYINDDDPVILNNWFLPAELNGQGAIDPTGTFLDLFVSEDRRAQVSLLTADDQTYIRKFWDATADPSGGVTPMDLHLIRYADILLMHAEALNEIRNGSNVESLSAINTVRARARFDGNRSGDVLPDLSQLNKGDFRSAILDERARELAWEGHRWFDLVRFGALKEALALAKPDINISAKQLLFPIPQRELDLNPNFGGQNPEY